MSGMEDEDIMVDLDPWLSDGAGDRVGVFGGVVELD